MKVAFLRLAITSVDAVGDTGDVFSRVDAVRDTGMSSVGGRSFVRDRLNSLARIQTMMVRSQSSLGRFV